MNFYNLTKKREIKLKYFLFFIIFLSLFEFEIVYAQNSAFTPGFGFVFPFGTSFGFISGTHVKLEFGKDFDESVFYGLGSDIIFTGIKWSKLNQIYKDSSSFIIPFYGTLRIRFPVSAPFSIFSNIGIGFSLLFDLVNPATNTTLVDNKMFLYKSFYWFFGVGIGFMLGSRTDGQIYLQLTNSNFSTNANDINYPFIDKFNMWYISIIFQIRFFKI
ncbi:MAG: hypothetical protein N3A58_03515 [Spirochaetes bacterium]|nr:hypothetical protein [Spirochaetota bacterium]